MLEPLPRSSEAKMTNSICEGDGHILMLPLYQITLRALIDLSPHR